MTSKPKFTSHARIVTHSFEEARDFVGRRVILQSIVWLFLYTIENITLKWILLTLWNKFYVQVDGLLFMLWVGFISIRRDWVNGLVYIVRDLQITLRMLGEIQSQWFVAQRDTIEHCVKWIIDS